MGYRARTRRDIVLLVVLAECSFLSRRAVGDPRVQRSVAQCSAADCRTELPKLVTGLPFECPVERDGNTLRGLWGVGG